VVKNIDLYIYSGCLYLVQGAIIFTARKFNKWGKESVVSMKVTRRQFLKVTGATAAGFALVDLGFDLQATASAAKELRIKNVTPTPTVCPYCASGCGLVIYAERDANGNFVKLLSVHGDPDNPINQGGACSKGAAMFNLREIYDERTGEQMINPKRVQKPLYRAPGSDKWEEKDWDWMLDRIAERVKETRDSSFIHKEKLEDGSEIIVNRTERIASIGGSGLDNEECYILSKMMRALGLVYLETQARI
jgi:formate dehydrogenase major subunit